MLYIDTSVEWSKSLFCRASVRGVVQKRGIDRLIHQTGGTQPARGNKEQARGIGDIYIYIYICTVIQASGD
jgi:hypothetical protein